MYGTVRVCTYTKVLGIWYPYNYVALMKNVALPVHKSIRFRFQIFSPHPKSQYQYNSREFDAPKMHS